LQIGQLLRPIAVGVKSKWFICLLTIASAYSSYLTHNPYLKLLSLATLLIATEIMIFVCGTPFLNNIFKSFTERNRISWDNVELTESLKKLASRQGVKLHKKKPLGIRKDFRNAYAIPWTRQIVVGDTLLKELSDGELLALLGHELTHIQQNHGSSVMLWVFYTCMLAVMPLSLLKAPNVVVNIVYVATFFLVFSLISRRQERLADVGAAAIAGPQAVISLLKHITPRNQWRADSDTHPSTLRRIVYLKKRSKSLK
jgi:Zn-dependent protease with chaperone function